MIAPPLFSPFTTPAAPAVAWYCLRVMAKREQVAARNLKQRTGATVFAPTIKVARVSPAGLASWVTEALFPGYIFARFGFPHDARHIGSTPGVLSLVAFGGQPPSISDDVITQLAAEVAHADAPAAAASIEAGTVIRVTAGCFRGHEGRVLHTASATARISVLLHLLGQDIQVSLPGDQLQDTTDHLSHVPAGLRASAALTAGGSR